MLTTIGVIAIICVAGGVVSLTRGQTLLGVILIAIGLLILPGFALA